jgi:hypothetical protein
VATGIGFLEQRIQILSFVYQTVNITNNYVPITKRGNEGRAESQSWYLGRSDVLIVVKTMNKQKLPGRSVSINIHFRLFRYVELKEDKFELLSKIIASLPQHYSWCTFWGIERGVKLQSLSVLSSSRLFLVGLLQKCLVRSCWLAGRINRNLPKVGQCRR